MRGRHSVLAGLVVLAGALPLLVACPAPLQDWPNHVARFHILHRLLHGDAFWARFYRFTGFLIPDAVMDVGVLGLTRVGVGVAVAVQAFLITTYAIFVAAFCALARVLGAFGPAKPAFAVLLFYGNALFWGLVSYVLGVGLLLALLAAWIAAGQRPAWRLGIAAAGGVVLLFTHAVPAVVWVVILGCFDLQRFLVSRARLGHRVGESASWLLALVVVGGLLRALPHHAGSDFTMSYAGVGGVGIAWRKLMLFARVLLGGSVVQDTASLVALLVCLAATLAGRPRIAAAPALASAALVGLALAAPERLGTGSLLDTRLGILPLILAAAAVRVTPAPWADRVVGAAVLARTLVLAVQFHAAGLVFRAFDRASAGLPAGSVMMMAFGTPLRFLTWQQVWSPPIQSIATQVVFRGVFMPAIFANPAQQPMLLRPAWRTLTQPWDLTNAAHLAATAAALAPVCAGHAFAGVYLTVLYPGAFIPLHVGAAQLHADPNFLILDACRLAHQA